MLYIWVLQLDIICIQWQKCSQHKQKNTTLICVLVVTDIKQRMLSGCSESYILNRHGLYDVVMSEYKFIHCDLTDKVKFLIVTFTIGATFVMTFSPCLNVGCFIQIQNFGVTFQNKFEKNDWSFVMRVRTTIVIEQIDPFFLHLHFVQGLGFRVQGLGFRVTWVFPLKLGFFFGVLK